MTVSVHDLPAGRAAQILKEIAAAHEFGVFVQYNGRWMRGCKASSLKVAIVQAETVSARSQLPVQVRDCSDEVVFEVRPGDDECTAGSATDPSRRLVCVH